MYIGETGRSMRERIKEHDGDIRFAPTQTSTVSEHANETGHIPIWIKVSLLIVTPTGTHVGSKRLSISDFIPTTSIGIAESTSSKLGYPRSNNTTADL